MHLSEIFFSHFSGPVPTRKTPRIQLSARDYACWLARLAFVPLGAPGPPQVPPGAPGPPARAAGALCGRAQATPPRGPGPQCRALPGAPGPPVRAVVGGAGVLVPAPAGALCGRARAAPPRAPGLLA